MNYNHSVWPTHGLWLWFDVEKGWITTKKTKTLAAVTLWFDVEKGWITTLQGIAPHLYVVVWCRKRMNYNNYTGHYASCNVVVWCRKRMNYNGAHILYYTRDVVVWCRKRMNYNGIEFWIVQSQLWFDVEKGWITTLKWKYPLPYWLWFDVEKGWITTGA